MTVRGTLVLFTPAYCWETTPLDNGAFGRIKLWLQHHGSTIDALGATTRQVLHWALSYMLSVRLKPAGLCMGEGMSFKMFFMQNVTNTLSFRRNNVVQFARYHRFRGPWQISPASRGYRPTRFSSPKIARPAPRLPDAIAASRDMQAGTGGICLGAMTLTVAQF